jgi:hypothetical protein
MSGTMSSADYVSGPITRTVPAPKTKLSPFEFRAAMRGEMDLSSLPFELMRHIQAARRKFQREQDRYIRRETKAQRYAAFGLNGHRAQARRIRQIEAGSLRVANGLVL